MLRDRSPDALRRADVRRCGTLWVAEPATSGERPRMSADVRIRVVRERDVEPLRRAMAAAEADNPGFAEVRVHGKRLGYLAEVTAEVAAAGAGEVLAYGWIARPGDTVDDLGFDIELPAGNVWIYDCATVSRARGRGLYTALLLTMRQDFGRYGIRYGWIGTAPRNWASQRGIARAGFLKVADMDWSGAYSIVYGVPGVSPSLMQLAASSLADGPDTRVVPGAGIPVIEGELACSYDNREHLPTDLLRFQSQYGEQIYWRDAAPPRAGDAAVTLRCQGRSLTRSATASFGDLVAALDEIAPGIPWLDAEPPDTR